MWKPGLIWERINNVFDQFLIFNVDSSIYQTNKKYTEQNWKHYTFVIGQNGWKVFFIFFFVK